MPVDTAVDTAGGGAVATEDGGGGESGVAAGDHSVTAGPRAEKPRFQKDEHVVYASEHPNWLALAEAFVSEASRRGGRYKTGRCKNHKCWREAIRFVAVSRGGWRLPECDPHAG